MPTHTSRRSPDRPQPAPPYGLAIPVFPFPALAFLAGQLPPGGGREVVLACLVGARLAHGMLPPYRLSAQQREARATAALGWLASLELDPALLDAARALIACTGEDGGGEPALRAAAALGELRALAGATLDRPAAAELDRLAARLLAGDRS